MRKLYLVIGLLALIPALDAAACGGNNDNTGGGGNSAGPGGGQVQDFSYDINVTWTLSGQSPSAALGADDTVTIVLSGTEDPGLHASKDA